MRARHSTVSIPLWFSLNEGLHWWAWSEVIVSIPLWFSLNLDGNIDVYDTLLFPSHYGSRSTIYLLRRLLITMRFHPTMVLAQRGIVCFCLGVLVCFHPTMVLAQRKLREFCPADIILFPSHYGSRSTNQPNRKRFGYIRFHPTMVLAQHNLLTYFYNIFVFPSHYGSRSTWF